MKQVLEAITFHLGVRLWNSVAKFMRWWLSELTISVPTPLRRYFSPASEKKIIRLHGDTLQVRTAILPIENWATFDPRENGSDLKTAAVLLLPAATVLRRFVELPSAAISSIHETVSFQISRITPFVPEQAFHVTRIVDRDRARKTIRTEVAVVPKAVLERMLTAISAHHIRLSAIFVEGDIGTPALDFLPHNKERSAHRDKMTWKPILVAGIIVLLTCPLVAAYRIHAAAKALEAEVAAAGKIVQHVTAARSQLDALITAETFLPEQQRGPRAIETLDALARLVPDNTWIFRLELRTSNVLLSGFTSDLPTLLQHLGVAPFSAPELTSPVASGLADGRSRFELRTQLRSALP